MNASLGFSRSNTVGDAGGPSTPGLLLGAGGGTTAGGAAGANAGHGDKLDWAPQTAEVAAAASMRTDDATANSLEAISGEGVGSFFC